MAQSEIAAANDVTYGDLMNAVAAAEQAGFYDWMLTDVAALSAYPSL